MDPAINEAAAAGMTFKEVLVVVPEGRDEEKDKDLPKEEEEEEEEEEAAGMLTQAYPLLARQKPNNIRTRCCVCNFIVLPIKMVGIK